MKLPELTDAPTSVQNAYASIVDLVAELDKRHAQRLTSLQTTREWLDALDLRDVLVAYLIHAHTSKLTAIRTTSRGVVVADPSPYMQRLVNGTLTRQINQLPAALTFIDVAVEYPHEALLLAGVAVSHERPLWPYKMAETNDLGRLTREIYDAAGCYQLGSRTDYLIRRLLANPRLSESQLDFVRVLAADWDGTLSDLIETTKALCPDVAVTARERPNAAIKDTLHHVPIDCPARL